MISGGAGLRLVRELGRNPETGQPRVAGVVGEDVRRLDVLMYEAVPVDLAKCRRQADGDAQEARQVERLPPVPLENPIQRITAGVLEYEDCPPFVTGERQRPGRPSGIEFRCERVFALKPPETLR
jgi:hypothetical protein